MAMTVKVHGRNTLQKRQIQSIKCPPSNEQAYQWVATFVPSSQGRRRFTNYCQLVGLVKLLSPPTIHLQPIFQYILLSFAKLIFIHL